MQKNSCWAKYNEDKHWPKEYAESQILVSSKDQKICQRWLREEDKKADQDAKEVNDSALRGALVVKKVIESPRLIGIPEAIATKSAGDYDRDHYSVIASNHLSALKAVLQEARPIVNPKITKTFTPRLKAGNLAQIHSLNLGLMERWAAVF